MKKNKLSSVANHQSPKASRKKRKEREREKELESLSESLRRERGNRAKEKGWELWGWIRENKHSLTSEAARSRIDAIIDFSVDEAYQRMVDALDLADQRNARAKAAETISSRANRSMTVLKNKTKAAERKLRIVTKRLEHAYDQMAKNGLALPKIAEQVLGDKADYSADLSARTRRGKTKKLGRPRQGI